MPKNERINNSIKKLRKNATADSEKKRLRLALEITRDSIWQWAFDTNEVILYNNPDFLKKFGYDKNKNKKSPSFDNFFKRIHPDDIDLIKNMINDYKSCLIDSHNLVYRLRDNEGEWHWISSRGKIIERDKNGRPLRLIGTHSDISEHIRIEESMRESLMLVETQFNSSPDMILIVDHNFKIIKINRVVSDHFDKNMVIGADAVDLLPLEYREIARQKLEHCITTGELQELEHAFSGGKWISARIVRLRFSDGPFQLMIISSDITDRKRVLEMLSIQKDLSLALAGSSNLKDLSNNVLDSVLTMEGIDSGGLYMWEKISGKLTLIAHRGLSEDFIKSVSEYTPDTAQAMIVSRGDPIFTSYAKLDFPKDEAQIKEGLKLLFVLPIKHENQVIAVLNLASHTNDDLPSGIRDGIEAIAGMLGDSITRVLAEEALKRTEEKYSKLISNIPFITWIISENGDLKFISPNINKIYGYTADEIYESGMSLIFERVHPDERQEVQDAVSKLLHEGKLFDLVYTMQRKDGEWTIFHNKALGTYKEEGIRYFYGINSDITEQKKAELAIRDSEKKYMTILQTAAEGIIIADINSKKFVFVNSMICSMLGYTEEELLEKYVNDIQPEENLPHALSQFEALAHNEIKLALSIPCLRKDGSVFLADIRASDLIFGEKQYIAGFFTDITERTNLEEKIRQAEKMEAIGQLAGGIAHDFNNELSIILGNTELLRLEAGSNPALLLYIENILKCVNRSSDLISQMLAFSRRGKYILIAVDINDLILEIISMLEYSIDKRIIIQKTLKANPSLTMGDPSQLKSAILNLAINARDAMPDGGKLSFSTEAVNIDDKKKNIIPYDIEPGRYIRINISDTGIGINKETLGHIFEPFFTTKESGKGSGMGLASVYGTIKNHKGMISVNSSPGKGTEFQILLPITENPVEEEKPVSIKHDHQPDVAARILLVEDEEELRKIAKKMLEKFGHNVYTCKDGMEAVKFYKKNRNKIDIVILDMIMPVMNGRDAFLAMQKTNPDIKALFISGFSLDGQAQEILDKGVIGFLQKPVMRDELLKKINEALKTINK